MSRPALRPTRPALAAVALLLSVLAGAASAAAAAPVAPQDAGPPDLTELTPWRVAGGRVLVQISPGELERMGLELVGVEETAVAPEPASVQLDGPALAFAIDPDSTLRVLRSVDGDYQPYGVLDGSLSVRGGFGLRSRDGRQVDLSGFRIHARWARSDGPGGLTDADVLALGEAGSPTGGAAGGAGAADAPGADLFQLCYPKIYFAKPGSYGQLEGDEEPYSHLDAALRFRAWDLVMTEALAERLGRPALAGQILGNGVVLARARRDDAPWSLPPGVNVLSPWGGDAGGDGADGGGDAGGDADGDGSGGDAGDGGSSAALGGGVIDLEMGALQSLVVLGHVGEFGLGRTGFSLTTIACNVGDVEIPWSAPMDEGHPGIAMGLFREHEGRFEQVGVSWIKHGFFAQSNSACTPCSGTTNGSVLGVGCSDTYGTSNNGNRFWLGPRDEWDPFTSTWACEGSYFDGLPVDCERDENGSGLNDVDHRLEAFDADLALPGARYYYEASFLVPGDVDPSNHIASRRAEIVEDSGTFFATTPTVGQGNPMVHGPAVLRWGQKRTIVDLAPDDGRVVLAVQVTPKDGGLWRYEYALYNWTLRGEVSAFAVPAASAFAAERTFRDIDEFLGNNWFPQLVEGNLRWAWNGVELPGIKVAGPLTFGSLYNFGFTSDRPPAVRDAVLTLHEPGGAPSLVPVETLAPGGLALSAAELSPVAGTALDLEIVGVEAGTQAAVVALSVDGLPLAPAPVLPPGLLVVTGGEAGLSLTVPAGLAGSEVGLVAVSLDAGLAVTGVSNQAVVAVR